MAKAKTKPKRFDYYELFNLLRMLVQEHDELIGYDPKMSDRAFAAVLKRVNENKKMFREWQKLRREMHKVLKAMESKKWVTVKFKRRR